MKPKLRKNLDGSYYFHCPACEFPHGFNQTWSFNGDLIRPTVQPSLLSKGVCRCHLFITDGKLQYLHDCDHDLAGKIIDMIAWDDD